MRSSDRSEATNLFQSNLDCQQLSIKLVLFFVLLIGFVSGCSKRVRPYSAEQAMTALNAQSTQVQSVRGRAWVSVKWQEPAAPGSADAHKKEQKGSFPAIIVVDRTDPQKPSMRIEAIDLVGTTHSLMILEKGDRFTWIDYDQRRVYTMRSTWFGLPLKQLPNLVLGLSPIVSEQTSGSAAQTGAADADGFEVRSGANRYEYGMSWIEPGPRLALSELSGLVMRGEVQTEKYVVEFSKFADKSDFYLPQEAQLKGYPRPDESADQPAIEVKIAWRERRWNDKIPDVVFRLPQSSFRGFTHEAL